MSLFGNRIEMMIAVTCFATAAALGAVAVAERLGWWIWLPVGAACAGGLYSLWKGLRWW